MREMSDRYKATTVDMHEGRAVRYGLPTMGYQLVQHRGAAPAPDDRSLCNGGVGRRGRVQIGRDRREYERERGPRDRSAERERAAKRHKGAD
jgi:hypothetical protein